MSLQATIAVYVHDGWSGAFFDPNLQYIAIRPGNLPSFICQSILSIYNIDYHYFIVNCTNMN